MKIGRLLMAMVATAISCSMAMAQNDDVIILNQDGEKVGVEQAIEVRKNVAGAETKVKVEDGQVTIIDADGTERTFKLGEARSVMVNRSVQTVDNNGQKETKSVGKVIVVDPDGQRHEFEFDGGDLAGMGGGLMGFSGVGRKTADGEEKPAAEKSYMIGVRCTPVSNVLRSQLMLEAGAGLVVERLVDDRPAAKAGVRVNDILMYADDQQLSTNQDLVEIANLVGKETGKFSLTLIRGGEEMNIEVEPVERVGLPTPRMRGFPADVQIFGDFGGMPGGAFDFEFKEMGPGVIVGPNFDAHPGFDRMNDKIKELHEKIENLHKSMLDDKIDQ